MNSKGNALKLWAIDCPALEVEGNKKESASNFDLVIGSVIASLTVDLKAEKNKTEALNTTADESVLTMENGPADVDLVQMINIDSGAASNPKAVTDITIDDNGTTKNNPNLGKRKQGDNDVIVVSSGSDTDLTTTSKGQKAKQARTDPAEEKKRLIQLIRSYPVLYDSKHSDIKTIGSKKAAYQEIGNKMGLTQKQVSTRWYNYYKTYKVTRNDTLLSFLGPFIDDSEASSSGSHLNKAKDENTHSFESSDETSNKSEASSTTSRSRKTKKVHFVGLSESASETENESDSDDIKSKTRALFQIPMKNSSKKGDIIWDIPDEEFIVLIRETIVGLGRAERKQLKKRIAKLLQF